jgi:hypothetical protein
LIAAPRGEEVADSDLANISPLMFELHDGTYWFDRDLQVTDT